MIKLDNKGYMLVEIILASVIAFGMAYFLLDMTIKLKNKNDDLLVETLTTTDQAIIMNKLMQYAREENDQFTCKLTTDGKTLYYEDKDGNRNIIDIVNDYAELSVQYNDDGTLNGCLVENGAVNITLPLSVRQMSDKNFDIRLNYKYQVDDMLVQTISTCTATNPKYTCSTNATPSSVAYKTDQLCRKECKNACRYDDSSTWYYCDMGYTCNIGTLSDKYCLLTDVSDVSECPPGWIVDVNYTYEFVNNQQNVLSCTVDSSFVCNSSTVGNSYVSACS